MKVSSYIAMRKSLRFFGPERPKALKGIKTLKTEEILDKQVPDQAS